MKLKCDYCGFEGERNLFRYISFDESEEVRQCPSCHQEVSCNLVEIFEENINQAQEMSIQLDRAVNARDVFLARKILKDLNVLSRSLNIAELNNYIKSMRKKLIALEKEER